MIPGNYNFICPQGSTFSKQLTWQVPNPEYENDKTVPKSIPVDLNTYTARMQVREKYSSKTTIIDINTENGGIVLGGEEGTIQLYVDYEVTESIVPKNYVYDIEMVSSSEVTRLLEGKFIVTPEVTK